MKVSLKNKSIFLNLQMLVHILVHVQRETLSGHSLDCPRYDLWSSHLPQCLLRCLKCPKNVGKYMNISMFFETKIRTFFGHICESVKQKVSSIWVKWKMFPVMNIFSRRLNFIVFHITKNWETFLNLNDMGV